MSLDLDYEQLRFQRTVAANSGETIAQGTVTLPERMPEIGRVVSLKAKPNLTTVEVRDGKVILEGNLDLALIYARYEERSVPAEGRADYDDAEDDPYGDAQEREVVVEERLEKATWTGEVPFAYLMDLPNAAETDEVKANARVTSCSWDLRSDQVSLDIDAALSLEARVEESVAEKVASQVKNASADVEVEKRPVRVRRHQGSGQAQAVVTAELSFAGRNAPDVILDIDAEIDIAEVSVDDGRVRVKGYIDYSAFYVGAQEAGPQYADWPRGGNFELEVPVDGARRGGAADVNVKPAPTQARIAQDGDEAALAVRTQLDVDVQAHEVRTVPALISIQSDHQEIAVRTERVKLVEAVGEGSVTERKEASLDLPEGSVGIERILFGVGEASVQDVHVLGDKVAVEIQVDIELAYVGRSGGDAVHVAHWPQAIGMDVEIPLEGAEPGLERSVEASVEAIRFDLVNRESVDVQVTVAARAKVCKDVEFEAVVEAVAVPPQPLTPPTYTYVVAEPGETLWKLAARYRSTPEVIAEANDWLDETDMELPTGRKVCVPRKVAR